MKVMKYAFFGELRKQWEGVKEVPGLMQFSMIALALICAGGGILLLPGLKEVFLDPMTTIFTEGTSYAEVVSGNL
jgi:formate hydrogenlyase subunit 3/multisubunit Na+/H+ antiporter MnhD subunit